MRPLGLVPRSLAFPLSRRIGFDNHRATGKRRFELAQRDPHRIR